MFSFLFNRSIGSRVAALYHAWALVLEQAGNTTKADMVYSKGIEMAAEPVELLRKQHQ
jgi:Mad3/BUB1 homology region 1